jgi:hypothetical protein
MDDHKMLDPFRASPDGNFEFDHLLREGKARDIGKIRLKVEG